MNEKADQLRRHSELTTQFHAEAFLPSTSNLDNPRFPSRAKSSMRRISVQSSIRPWIAGSQPADLPKNLSENWHGLSAFAAHHSSIRVVRQSSRHQHAHFP